MQQEEGLPDEDIDSAMDFLVGIVRDGIMGKFTRESIEMAIKAIRHDSDVEAAGHEGEVKGRNSKIEEKLRKAGKMTVQPTLPVKTVVAVAVHDRCLTSVQSGVMMVHRTFGSVAVKNARR